MVEADVCNDGYQWLDDVCAIQPSSQAYFDHGYVNKPFFEILEGHCCGDLEERWMQRFEERTMFLNEIHYKMLTDGSAIDAYALTEIYEVRRGVETYAIATLLQHGCNGVRHAALAVGSTHMDGFVGLMGVA